MIQTVVSRSVILWFQGSRIDTQSSHDAKVFNTSLRTTLSICKILQLDQSNLWHQRFFQASEPPGGECVWILISQATQYSIDDLEKSSKQTDGGWNVVRAPSGTNHTSITYTSTNIRHRTLCSCKWLLNLTATVQYWVNIPRTESSDAMNYGTFLLLHVTRPGLYWIHKHTDSEAWINMDIFWCMFFIRERNSINYF